MCLSFVTRKCNVIFSSTPSSTPSYKYIFCNIFSQDEFIAIQKPNQHIQTDWFIWQGGLPFIDYWMLSTPYCTALQGPAWINDYTRYIYTYGINLHVFFPNLFHGSSIKTEIKFHAGNETNGDFRIHNFYFINSVWHEPIVYTTNTRILTTTESQSQGSNNPEFVF